jgi:hypothetical protein
MLCFFFIVFFSNLTLTFEQITNMHATLIYDFRLIYDDKLKFNIIFV